MGQLPGIIPNRETILYLIYFILFKWLCLLNIINYLIHLGQELLIQDVFRIYNLVVICTFDLQLSFFFLTGIIPPFKPFC